MIAIYIFLFLFLHETYVWYALEVPYRDASNEYHDICFRAEIKKKRHFGWKKSTLSGAILHACAHAKVCLSLAQP